MKNILLKFYAKYEILTHEHGQDLIEYALVVSLIAFAATARARCADKDSLISPRVPTRSARRRVPASRRST